MGMPVLIAYKEKTGLKLEQLTQFYISLYYPFSLHLFSTLREFDPSKPQITLHPTNLSSLISRAMTYRVKYTTCLPKASAFMAINYFIGIKYYIVKYIYHFLLRILRYAVLSTHNHLGGCRRKIPKLRPGFSRD